MADQKFFIANNLFFVPAQTNVVIRGIFVVDRVFRPRVRLAVRAYNIGWQSQMISQAVLTLTQS